AVEADLTGLVALRQRIKGDVARRHSIDLTYVPFVALATVEALQEFPTVNAAWGGDCLVLRKRVHLGLAVSVADGLLVPVIRGADGMNLLGLARMCADLISRARQGRLTPDDMQGAAFTLNNTGALGSIISRPIVPPGQSGILNMEAIIKRPVVRDDAIAVRSMMNLCLSFDHRILDGREALGFLHAIRRRLEAWRADDAPL
ncbi:MAG: 2-oxo acid dehydrogenase subunit E2, partial [Chloroflexi bacterium]|nr:2-oxo acid dehydrogenase subunit E2 [Chloroflexota bacterium]